MKLKLQVLSLLLTLSIGCSNKKHPLTFTLGDSAPLLRVRNWIKGNPVEGFEKGKIYIVEFWATWCKPCVASMPHLSTLAHEYNNKVTVLAIDVYEKKTTSLAQVKAFVHGMGDKMGFPVAAEDTSFTVHDWLEASNEKDNGIPITFVVNGDGNIAWIGHPKDLDNVLSKILDHTWDIKKALAQNINNSYLEDLDREAVYKLEKYRGDYYKLDDLGKPDSTLIIINEMLKKEPKLKYAPVISLFTFSALLKTDQHKAYEYGKELMVTSTYEGPAYGSITGVIKDDARKLKFSKEIYRLGAECYQKEIDEAPYPDLIDMPKLYNNIAALYSMAGDKSKATDAEQKALRRTN